MIAKRARAMRIGALALAAAAAGCRDEPSGPEPVFKGNYWLVSIGGTPLPFKLPPTCPPFDPCMYPQSGRREVQSRGRVRDILEVAYGPPPWRFIWDTIISPYRLDDRRLILFRDQFGGSVGKHNDTGEVDLQGRVLIVPKNVGLSVNTSLFLYAPTD